MQYQTINPATGQLIDTVATMSDSDLDAALARAQHVFESDWRHRSIAERASIVGKAAQILRERTEEFSQLITLEMGKRIGEARVEVGLSASILEYYAEHAANFLRARAVPEVPDAEVRVDPFGVLLGIEPWNFPYYQVARVAGPQLMVGNVLLLKHAENVPKSALAFARLFEEAGAPAGVYTNLYASIDQIGRVIDDPRVRGVTLTGSERAGSAVAERAGRALKKVVLELGGSDPLIALEDAPLDWTISSAVAGRMFNCGQCCVGTKRVIVVGEARGNALIDGMREAMSALRAGDPADAATTLAPLSSERALTQLLGQIERAIAAGATLVCGGKRIDRPGFYLEPTILTDIVEDNPLYREETFGPVVSIYIVKDEEEAIRVANGSPYGLGSSVFSADLERASRVANAIDSGMVFVNRPFGTTPQLPFGGVKNSGFGRELSEAGFEEFVNKKLVYTNAVGTPPFGRPKAA